MSATSVWQGIASEHPPCLRLDYPELLEMAEALVESRRKRFPDLVRRHELSAPEAARQLALFEEIAADWRWICTGEGEPAAYATIEARREALDESLRTVAGIARGQGGFDAKLEHQAHCLIALRWHLEPERMTHALARLTHQCRAAAPDRVAPKARPEPVEGETVDA